MNYWSIWGIFLPRLMVYGRQCVEAHALTVRRNISSYRPLARLIGLYCLLFMTNRSIGSPIFLHAWACEDCVYGFVCPNTDLITQLVDNFIDWLSSVAME